MAEITHNLESLKKAQIDFSLKAARRAGNEMYKSSFSFSDPEMEAKTRKFDLFLSKMNGSVITGGRREAYSEFYCHCEYQARDAENCKTEAEALLLMAQMLREDANRIEEFAKSMQNESTNQG